MIEKTYLINNNKIVVIFENKLIRIKIPEELVNYIVKNKSLELKKLVEILKSDYLSLLNKDLKITTNSLVSEIYGHIYASKLAKKLKKLIKTNFTNRILNFIIHRSDSIDCGESDIDTNRWLWDILSKLKFPIINSSI
jgi:hypothetical protein